MNIESPCLDLEYMELEEEDRLTERDALMLGVERETDDSSFTDPRG